MKALLVGDIHLADRPPSIRVEGYAEQIHAKLCQTVMLAKSEKVDAVVWAGDVFHIKAPTRTSHRLVQSTARLVKSYPCPVYIVPGNHDMTNDRLESISEKQPLGVLFEAGAIPLVGEAQLTALDQGIEHLFGIPWLRDWKTELPSYMKQWQESSAELMVTHAPIVKPDEDRPFEIIDALDWAKMMGREGSVYYGHMHDPDGSYAVGQVVFCNQGAISRGSLHEATLKRKPAVTIWDSDELSWTRHEIEHLPASEVFQLSVKEDEDARQERLAEFLGAIGQTTFEALTIEGVMAHVAELELDDDVRREIQECLEVAL